MARTTPSATSDTEGHGVSMVPALEGLTVREEGVCLCICEPCTELKCRVGRGCRPGHVQ